MREEDEWMEKAEHDLNTAKVNLEQKIYDASAFFIQQAVEKALKAIFIKRKKELVKTHDLNFLGREVGLPKELLEMCNRITTFYVESRYPDSYTEFDEDKISSSIRDAEKVISWAKKKV